MKNKSYLLMLAVASSLSVVGVTFAWTWSTHVVDGDLISVDKWNAVVDQLVDVSVNSDWNAVSGYERILNKPTIPAAQVSSDWNSVSGVSMILNKPTIPAAQVPSDWNSSVGVDRILNKPTIPAAQVSSDWNSVSGVSQILNKPTIPAAQVSSDWSSSSGVSQILNKPWTVSGSDQYSALAGNVGIGASGPTAKLTVTQSTNNVALQGNGGRYYLLPSASTPNQGLQIDTASLANGSNALFLNAPTGWTGNFESGNLNGVQQFAIAQNGNTWFNGTLGVGIASPNAKFTIGNNVATGPMDTYAEYQMMLHDSGTPSTSYGLGIRSNTLLFNSASLVDFDIAGVNILSASTASLDLKASSTLRLYDTDSSHYVGFKSPTAVTSNVTWTLPSADGAANSVLTTSGAGVLSWSSMGNSNSVKRLPETKDGGVFYYNCVIMGDDTVKCWGQDNQGQIGDGSPASNRYMPTTVLLPGPASKLYTNTGNVIVLLADGTVYSWGYNGSGEVGNGNTTHQYYAVRVGTLTGVTKIAISADLGEVSGNSACALTSAGAVYCWGYNGYGQVGDNTTTARSSPTLIVASGVSDIYDGQGYYGNFCLKKTDNSTWCWGYNGYGNVGDNTTVQKNIPTNISFSTVSQMGSKGSSSAYGHRCAVKTDGTVWCWGNNSNGQLGDGTVTQRNVPTQVSGITTATYATVGLLNSWVLLSDGTVRSWGYNSYGQLGNGTTTQSNSPVTVTGVTGATKIVSGGDNYAGWYISACALINNGTVKCWGYNGYGQLGDDTTTARSTPITVVGITNAVDIMFRGYYSGSEMCALLSTGALKCWGYNSVGQIGNGTTTNMYSPQDVFF